MPKAGCSPRPSTRSSCRPQRTDYQSPCEPMRDLRALGKYSSTPHPKARRPRQVRPNGEAGMGGDHGKTAPQVPCGLPPLPRHHPRPAASRKAHGVVTGEPDAFNGARPVRWGATRKRTCTPRAPRRVAYPALDCLKPSLQKVQEPHLPERRLKPVPRSAPDYLVAGRNLRSVGRCPVAQPILSQLLWEVQSHRSPQDALADVVSHHG